ncbi:hypothetical protein BHM03_00020975 [Ensete ventricosum]|nr:hypothetical protein BHM03_00020975 [Ensete ventricosum]
MAENCSVLDTWMYRSYACISEAAIERENDALTKALQISLLRDSSSAPSAIPSPESFSTATSSLLCLPAAVNECHRRDPPAGRVAKKRRSRASKRSPTTYIATDPANFRELVQRATGTRAAGSAGEHQYPAAAVQGSPLLPTLDTSSFLHDRADLAGPDVAGWFGPTMDGPVLPEFDPFFVVSTTYPMIDTWGLSRMGRTPGSGLGGRLLEWWSSGRVEMFQLGLVADSCKKVRSGRVGSRRDPSDGQVSFVVDFAIPLLGRSAGAFIAIVMRYPYLKLLSSLLLTILLHLATSSVVFAARRAPAAGGCRPCPPYPC